MESVARHETVLTAYALERLRTVPGITLYGETDPARTGDRVGVISFNIRSVPHALVAAILGYEAGIGVRSGCFCAQSYVAGLLGIDPSDRARRRAGRPGMVRMSLGLYNTVEDVDALVAMLQRISNDDYEGEYSSLPGSGDLAPLGYDDEGLISKRAFSYDRAHGQEAIEGN
jgi:selenocysteine lyase/cysteine desulfurase